MANKARVNILFLNKVLQALTFWVFHSREVFIICMTNGTGKKKKHKKKEKKNKPIHKSYNQVEKGPPPLQRAQASREEPLKPNLPLGTAVSPSLWFCDLYTAPRSRFPLLCKISGLNRAPPQAECMCVHACLLSLRIWHKSELTACLRVRTAEHAYGRKKKNKTAFSFGNDLCFLSTVEMVGSPHVSSELALSLEGRKNNN